MTSFGRRPKIGSGYRFSRPRVSSRIGLRLRLDGRHAVYRHMKQFNRPRNLWDQFLAEDAASNQFLAEDAQGSYVKRYNIPMTREHYLGLAFFSFLFNPPRRRDRALGTARAVLIPAPHSSS
jgi:hypothetical protein